MADKITRSLRVGIVRGIVDVFAAAGIIVVVDIDDVVTPLLLPAFSNVTNGEEEDENAEA